MARNDSAPLACSSAIMSECHRRANRPVSPWPTLRNAPPRESSLMVHTNCVRQYIRAVEPLAVE
jgi:hypothetical protein